jgi:hypothetical protein
VEVTEQRTRRRELRQRIASLRERLRQAVAAKKHRMRELVRAIRAERLALRDRLREDRRRALEELRAAARAARVAVQEEWRRRVREARQDAESEVARLRAELTAERTQHAAEAKIARGLRADRDAHALAQRQQSDDHVRSLIPRELVPMFDRVARSIRSAGAQTRAEAFLRYAERHAEEAFKVVEPRAHQTIEATRDELADAARAATRGTTNYAEKRDARIERMRAKAARLEVAAKGAHAQARAVADLIPMGQPVLVGHHSQRRHERDLDRMRRSFTKSVELTRDAEALARRADRAERSTAVSSDDPEAVEKLREKLARLNASRERMRAANAAIRSGGDVVGALVALGFREDQARKLLERDFGGRVGFPDYALRNAAGEAARVERRIKELERRATTAAPAEVVIGDARISEAENRVRITFPEVPPEALRRALKGRGFRWAPSVGAWQRQASPGAWHAAKEALASYAVPQGEARGA